MSILSGIAGFAIAAGKDLPPVKQAIADIDFVLGVNEASRARWNLYRNNVASVELPRGVNKQPMELTYGELIKGYNQELWSRYDADPNMQQQIWDWLRWTTKKQGVDIGKEALPGPAIWNGIDGVYEANQRRALIEMSSAAAPLGGVIRDYYRSRNVAASDQAVTQAELEWNLARAELRRKEDRDRILTPFVAWGVHEIMTLRWLGVLTPEKVLDFLAAAGVTKEEDVQMMMYLSAKRPDPPLLLAWRARMLWDDNLAARYGLDGIPQESPVADFFARVQGAGQPQAQLPGQPAGSTDWNALGYRASRPLPDFGVARTMQHRLRVDNPVTGESVVPGIMAWTESNTRDMLAIAAYPQPIIDRLMGLVDEPLNIRLINHVLTPMATHPDVVAAAAAAFGPGYDWITRALLDHGFSASMAAVASAGIVATADDRANAERIEHEKRLRQEARARAIADFELGTVNANDASDRMVDKFYTLAMATTELNVVQKTIDAGVIKVKIDAIHQSYMDGTKSAPDSSANLDAIGITPNRRDQYLDEWAWSRIGKLKMLSTGEITSALKNGLLSAPAALVRLTNLGWHQPDALIEIAQVQHDLMLAQQKTADATANKIAAEAHHAQQAAAAADAKLTAEQKAAAHAKAAAEKTAAAEAAKQAVHNAKVAKDVLLAGHEKLLATSDYYKGIHLSNSAYATAVKAKDTEKQAAELAKNVSLYQKYLIDQLKLVSEGPEVAHEIEPLDAAQAPGPQPSQGSDPTVGATGTTSGGTASPPGTTGATP
jgi:hypothetical protein